MLVSSLYRYPVKGLSPERLDGAVLTAGDYFPGDRLFAIENGPCGFDPAAPEHKPKIVYLMLMRHEVLAKLRSRYDDASGELSIALDGREMLRAATTTPEGRAAITAFFEGYMPEALRGRPELLTAPAGYRFTDSRSGFVSIINLASVADLGQRIGAALDPLRFRGNVMVEDLPAWAENDLAGAELATETGIRLQVIKRIERCAATNVDPQSGARDQQIPKALMQNYGHVDCGIYCRVLSGGRLRPGDRLEPVTAAATSAA